MTIHLCAGLLAHVDAGKTTLSEALLYQTGEIRTLGRVDHQDAYLDTDAQERERGITIFSKQAHIRLGEREITLLDTPGHVDFSAEMERTLQVLDYAILVVSGTDGVQGHTRTLWRLLRHYAVPTFLFVNKMDLPGADHARLMAELRQELSDSCVDFSECPDLGENADALECADLPGSGAERQDASNFYESLAVCSEALLNEYMESGTIADASIGCAVAKRQVFPCFFGSALKLEGVEELLRGLARYTAEPVYPAEFAARVYKIGRDERGVRLTYLKLTGGSLKPKDRISYPAEGQRRERNVRPAAQNLPDAAEPELSGEDLLTEKIEQIRRYSGEKYEVLDQVSPGEVCVVTGLSSTFPGQGLGAEAAVNLPVLEPVLNYRMILPAEVNPAEFLKNMRLLEEEDPQLYVVWKEEAKEIHVQLMGQIQMEVLARQIKDRFGVVVTFGAGSIVYKETIAAPVEGVGHFEPLRHYAEVHLLLAPGERGSGISVDSVCSEDVLDRNWQRLIATHVEEREHKGVLTGSGLTDVKVTILTGRAHPKHTVGGDFRQATYRAIRQGLKSAECILLEPYYRFSLQIPMEYVGRAMTDLENRFGHMDAPEFFTAGTREMARIAGRAPVATMQDYISEVHAYTKGLGSLSLELSGYDICHNPQEVIALRAYDSEADLRNPTGSVFCAHGSGFVVPWDEVENYMHLPYAYHGELSREELEANNRMKQDGYSFGPGDLAQSRRAESWEKTVAAMSETELDAKLSDVYAREFGLTKEELEEQSRRKWAKKPDGQKNSAQSVPHVKYDKKGNPIYPAKGPTEEYLIVDGYNIIFSWDELKELSKTNMDAARDSLKDTLCNYQGYRRCHLILVFDAYKVKGHAGKTENYQGIEVVYTRQDETADAFIERKVHDIREKYRVTVATSDGLEQQTVLSLGALRMSARELKENIERTTREGYESYVQMNKK
jgi:small GTP-binding protein